MSNYDVDIIVLTRDDSPIRVEVIDSLKRQQGICGSIYQVVGRRLETDKNRWETIARARNKARELGDSQWVMFVDDDVELESNCIATLVNALESLPSYGAMAADYLGESTRPFTSHVSMGATLFRRSAIRSCRFRWESQKCECRCCCEDLERQGLRTGYFPAAKARHLEHTKDAAAQNRELPLSDLNPVILAALDAGHFGRFQNVFLRSLAASGNEYPVMVVGYGLSSSHHRALAMLPAVTEVLDLPHPSFSPAVLRVRDFPKLLSKLPGMTPAAWWDAGDVLFQDDISPVWDYVRAAPDKLVAVREPKAYPQNTAITAWPERIPNPQLRRRVFDLISRNPFFNSGFVASTAQKLIGYLDYAERFLTTARVWREQPMDQLAFNCYIHQHKDELLEVEDKWNYCLAFRGWGKLQKRRPKDSDWHPSMAVFPRFVTRSGKTIPVVHGNAKMFERTFRQWWSHPCAS